jgi:hypothetical protein
MKRYFLDVDYGKIHWVDDDNVSAGLVGFNKEELRRKMESSTTICFDIGKTRLCEININDLERFCASKQTPKKPILPHRKKPKPFIPQY